MIESMRSILQLPSLVTTDQIRDVYGPLGISVYPPIDLVALGMSRIARSPHLLELVTLPAPRLPLGRFFERCVELMLVYGQSEYEVFSNIKTSNQFVQGELDFVLRSIHETIHLEVALKFFLYRPQKELIHLSHFHGPNLNDRLDLKLDKLILSQLQKPVPESYLAPSGFAKPTKALWLSGILFYPWQMFWEQSVPSTSSIGINPLHQKSWWARAHEIEESLDSTDSLILNLPKSHWFKPIEEFSGEDIQSFKTTLEDLYNLEDPIMVHVEGQVRFNRKIRRGFVVPDKW